jgi:hypothetical protein
LNDKVARRYVDLLDDLRGDPPHASPVDRAGLNLEPGRHPAGRSRLKRRQELWGCLPRSAPGGPETQRENSPMPIDGSVIRW